MEELKAKGSAQGKVLNQEGHGTCVGYSFSVVMQNNLLEKYGVACDSEKVVQKVKTLHVYDHVGKATKLFWHARRVEQRA